MFGFTMILSFLQVLRMFGTAYFQVYNSLVTKKHIRYHSKLLFYTFFFNYMPWNTQGIDTAGRNIIGRVQNKHMIYSYCNDIKRFSNGLTNECKRGRVCIIMLCSLVKSSSFNAYGSSFIVLFVKSSCPKHICKLCMYLNYDVIVVSICMYYI